MTLPSGWSEQTIADVAEIIRGVTYSKADTLTEKDKDAVPLLRATNLEPGQIDYDNMVYIPKSGVKSRQFLQIDDIFLAASSGSISVVGKSAQVKEVHGETFGAFCAVIRPLKISPKYLGLWVQTPFVRDLWSSAAKGTNINNLKPSDLSQTKIPVPPLPEQEKIVEILEDHLYRLDAALADVKQAKLKVVSFRNSVLHEVFSGFLSIEKWEEFEVKNLGKWVTGSTPKSSNPANQGKKVPFLTPGDVSAYGKIELIERSISEIGADSVRRVTPPSVNLVCIGATLGKVGWTDKEITSNQQINSLVVDIVRHNPEFIMWLFSNYEMQRILWGASSSTTVPILNKGKLEKLKVSLPSLAEQTRLLVIIQEQISGSERFLKTAEVVEVESSALRRSLLQAAFTGQLTKEEVNV